MLGHRVLDNFEECLRALHCSHPQSLQNLQHHQREFLIRPGYFRRGTDIDEMILCCPQISLHQPCFVNGRIMQCEEKLMRDIWSVIRGVLLQNILDVVRVLIRVKNHLSSLDEA